MEIVFQHPYAAMLLLLLPLLGWRSGHHGDCWQRWLRTTLLTAMVLALSQPTLLTHGSHASAVFVVDQREHLTAAQKAVASAAIQARMEHIGKTLSTVIQLGGSPLTVKADHYLHLEDEVAGSMTMALEAALRVLPRGGKGSLTLITDGLSSDRHWQDAVATLLERGIVIDTLSLPATTRTPFISQLQPAPVRVGETLRVQVRVEGEGHGLRVALSAAGEQSKLSPAFDVNGVTTTTLTLPVKTAGFTVLHAVLRDANGVEHDRFNTVVAVQSPLPVLYLGGERDAGIKLQRLLGDGFKLTALQPNDVPATLDLASYRLVLINNLAPSQMPEALQHRLMEAVRDQGVGLVHSGDAAAFSSDPSNTGLSLMLPLSTSPQQQMQIPSVALAIVIDSSGSMDGAPMELAKQVARLAVRRLGTDDRVGVIEFYGARQWAVPMQPARSPLDIERIIGRMQAKGATVLFPAIQEAYFGLKAADTRYKHMLVISDAVVEEENYARLLRHVQQDGINVSTVMVGGDALGERRMADMASWGGGRFYAVADESSLVDLNFKMPQRQPASDDLHGSFVPRLQRGQSWWQDMLDTQLPALHSYARVRPRAGAQVLAVAGDADDALVASWQYGVGRVSSLAFNPLGAGTAGWELWSDYDAWLGRLLAHSADQRADYDLRLQRRYDRLSILVRDLRRSSTSAPTLHLRNVDGKTALTAVPLEQKAPGLFTAEMYYDPATDVLAELVQGDQLIRQVSRAYADVQPEGRLSDFDGLPLQLLTQLSGGHVVQSGQPFTVSKTARNSEWSALALWPWFSLAALLLYLFELGCRRWPGLWNRTR